jgi:tight adherence protein C
VIAALLLGVTFGFAAFASWRLLFPPAPPLSAAIARLQRRNALTRITSAGEERDTSDILGQTIGASIGRVLTNLGMRLDRLEPDLRLVGRSLDQHLGQKVLVAFVGLAMAPAFTLLMQVADVNLGFTIPSLLSIALAILFFFLPDLAVRSEAAKRRDDFGHALGSFLDLVVISLAGGAGVESALRDAASIGQGWAFAQLRGALDAATLSGDTPWTALARLGEDLGVSALAELSSSVALAGTEGARVRESLAVKATSLRDHALAKAEAEAQSTTERMAIPLVMLFVGFLILIVYPAMSVILGDF